jgi:quercetin dioxygenase-like cupin family protein
MMDDIAISHILNLFERHASDICRGDLSFAEQIPFVGTNVQKAPNGSTVITVAITKAMLDQLPANHCYIDLFLLESGRELGPHHHKHATAHVYGIEGSGTAVIGNQQIELGKSDKAVFPAGVTHNVITKADFFLFASFQDHSIIREDGSLDYFVDA